MVPVITKQMRLMQTIISLKNITLLLPHHVTFATDCYGGPEQGSNASIAGTIAMKNVKTMPQKHVKSFLEFLKREEFQVRKFDLLQGDLSHTIQAIHGKHQEKIYHLKILLGLLEETPTIKVQKIVKLNIRDIYINRRTS